MLKARALRNQKGMAVMEIIPVVVIVMLFLNYSLGFFGAIHTGILNSISARNYAFETFSHRANLVYFRDDQGFTSVSYEKLNFRSHATISDKVGADTAKYVATERRIDFMNNKDDEGTADTHNKEVYTIQAGKPNNAGTGVNPIWVMPQYGICLNSTCTQTN